MRHARPLVVLLHAFLLLASQSRLDAQAAAPAADVRGALVGPVKLEISLTDGGYATVFAVGRGAAGSPMAILAPKEPGARETLKRDKWYAVRALRPIELVPFATLDSALVVVFTSAVQPNLASFADGNTWAVGLALPDSIANTDERLTAVLAAELYPNGEPHQISMSMSSLTAPLRDGRLPPCPSGAGETRVPFVIRRVTTSGGRSAASRAPEQMEIPNSPVPRAPTCDPNRKPDAPADSVTKKP